MVAPLCAQQSDGVRRIHGPGFSIVPPKGWTVTVDPSLGHVHLKATLGGRHVFMFVSNWEVSQALADSGAEWWFDRERQSFKRDSAARDSLAREQEARQRETRRPEIPSRRMRGELRVDTVGSLRLYVEERAFEGCFRHLYCKVDLIYSAYYLPPDYRERRQQIWFYLEAENTVPRPGQSLRELFPELELLKAVEASFLDERPVAAPTD
jgi:hypothetical protein